MPELVACIKRRCSGSFATVVIISKIFFVISVWASQIWFAAPAEVRSPISVPLLVLYANETVADASSGRNYRLLFGALRKAEVPGGESIISALERDAEKFSQLVETQISILRIETVRVGFDAAVFTNEMARRGRFLFLRSTGQSTEEPAFVDIGPAPSEALHNSPLSRAVMFQSALVTVAQLPGVRAHDVILITSSHGDETTAIMPRVFADYTNVNEHSLLGALGPLQVEGASSRAIPRLGISKTDYWKAVAVAAPELRFALVVREACQSGVLSFGELATIPGNVTRVAHTRGDNIKIDHIDYAKLLGGLDPSASMVQQIERRLQVAGLAVDSRWNLLVHLVWRTAASLAPVLLFFPLMVWVAWAAPRLWRA